MDITCYGCGTELSGNKKICPDCGSPVGKALDKDPATIPANPAPCAFFDEGICRWRKWRREDRATVTFVERAADLQRQQLPGARERVSRIQRALLVLPSKSTLKGIDQSSRCTACTHEGYNDRANPVEQALCDMYVSDGGEEPDLKLRLEAAFQETVPTAVQPTSAQASAGKPRLTILSAHSFSNSSVGSMRWSDLEEQIALLKVAVQGSDELIYHTEKRDEVLVQKGEQKEQSMRDFISASTLVVVWVTPELWQVPECMAMVDMVADLVREKKVIARCVLAKSCDWYAAQSPSLSLLFRYRWLPSNHTALDAQTNPPDQYAHMQTMVQEWVELRFPNAQ